VAEFSDLYGTDMTSELGSSDTTERFTTVLRKRYVNEGQREFNYQTDCFVKRAAIALIDEQQEYDLEDAGVITTEDYIKPAKVSASLRKYDGSGSDPTDYSYSEGPELPFKAEEELNQTRPGWRSASPGVPECWFLRNVGGVTNVGLYPPPDIPAAETWVLLFPYIAEPTDMVDDSDEPYTDEDDDVATRLRPYHKALLHYGAAQLEKLRKNYEAVERQMKAFAAYVAKYKEDQMPPRGSSIRMKRDPRRSLRSDRPVDPYRY
jgi:hypothetical protein